MPGPIDVDDPDTWPAQVLSHAQNLARALRGTAERASSLHVSPETEDDFRAMLRGHLVRAYHATRLLDHETQAIQEQGLRPLSAQLIHERVEAAYEHSSISAEVRDQLHQAHVFAEGEAEIRAGKVFLFVGEHILQEGVGVWSLLGTRGGEGIYMSAGGHAMWGRRLLQMGRPAIVVADVDLSFGWRTHMTSPALEKVFVGRILRLEDAAADVYYPAPVLPGQIVAIWTRGSLSTTASPRFRERDGFPCQADTAS